MNYKIFFSVLILGIGISPIVQAEVYSANQLVEMAIRNSSLIKASGLDAESKAKLVDQASAWDNPVFGVEAESKDEAGGTTRSIRYGLSQTFYLPGKFSARKQVFKMESEIAKLDLASTEMKLRSYILNLVYEYKAAKEKLTHAEERFERFKTVEGFLKSRTFAAPQKKAEARIVSAKLIVLQREQSHLQVEKENLWSELNSYLNLNSEPDIKSVWLKQGPKLSFEELSNSLISNNADLKRQEARVTQTLSEYDLAKFDAWPGLTVAGSYSDGTGYSPEKIYGLGIAIPIPVLNTNRASKSAAEIRSRAEKERSNYVTTQITRDLRVAFLHYESAKKLVNSLPVQKIDDLEKAIRETDKDFRRGQVDLLTYLEADAQHFESLSVILESQLEMIKRFSDLQVLTGFKQTLTEN